MTAGDLTAVSSFLKVGQSHCVATPDVTSRRRCGSTPTGKALAGIRTAELRGFVKSKMIAVVGLVLVLLSLSQSQPGM